MLKHSANIHIDSYLKASATPFFDPLIQKIVSYEIVPPKHEKL